MGFSKLTPIPQPAPDSSSATGSHVDAASLIQQKQFLRASLEQRLSDRPSPEEIAKAGADSSSANFFETLKTSLFGKKKRREMEISAPVSFSHNVHVSFDYKTSTGYHVSILNQRILCPEFSTSQPNIVLTSICNRHSRILAKENQGKWYSGY
jgi:hypothetical protein